MRSNPLCLYHAHCADGLAAAWAVRHALPYVECVPVSYGDPLIDFTEVSDRDLIIVDFSYSREVLRQLSGMARSVLILDHHKTAIEDLAGLPKPKDDWRSHLDACGAAGSNVVALFDLERSGAGLAWDFFHPGEERPWLLDRVEDRDLWRFKLDHSREVNAVIHSYPDHDMKSFDIVMMLCDKEPSRGLILREGEAILRRQLRDLESLLPNARRAIIRGFDVPILNCPYWLASEAGNHLSIGEPFSATYFDGPKQRGFSLRSQPGAVDVSAVAKLYGGGGHERAAGFSAGVGWEGDVL